MPGKTAKHVAFANWANQQAHPLETDDEALEAWTEEALEWCLQHDAGQIRSFREEATQRILRRAEELRKSGKVDQWLEKVHPKCRRVVQSVNGPLLKELMEEAGYNGENVLKAFEEGVDMIGPLKGSAYGARLPRKKDLTSENELWAGRRESNKKALSSLADDPHEEALMEQLMTEAYEGKISFPWRVKDEDADGTRLCPRFGREQGRRANGEARIRAIDNGTKHGHNDGAEMTRKLKMGKISQLVSIARRRYRAGRRKTKFLKADVGAAFRRNPVKPRHRWLTTALFRYKGEAWAAQHHATPFGFIASVPAWDIVGEALEVIITRLLWIAVLRYVDDYFAAEDEETAEHALDCMKKVVDAVLGENALSAEKCEAKNPLTVLGIELNVKGKTILCTLPEAKRLEWARMASEAAEEGCLSSGDAATLGGRLAFAAQHIFRRFGRAMLRPIYRQQHQPLREGRISNELRDALKWWADILQEEIAEAFEMERVERRHVHLLCDASGNNAHLAAVLMEGKDVRYVEMVTPADWSQWFVQREDKQIMGLEVLAIMLGLESFRNEIRGANLTIWTDNAGAEGALVKGASKNADHNIMMHLFWKRAALDRIGVWIRRVPTCDNIADGPTRGWFEALFEIGAVPCHPSLPKGGKL